MLERKEGGAGVGGWVEAFKKKNQIAARPERANGARNVVVEGIRKRRKMENTNDESATQHKNYSK